MASAAGEITHLNVPVLRLVHLKMRFSQEGGCTQLDNAHYDLVRVKATGDQASDTYIVPASKDGAIMDRHIAAGLIIGIGVGVA